jgi:hypothetical protein
MIDYGCYRSTFDMILSPMIRFLLFMTGTGFNLVGELENRGDGDERSMVMVVELEWIKI